LAPSNPGRASGHLGQRFERREVDDVHRGAGHPGELDRPVGGLGLEQGVADDPVVPRVGLAALQRLGDEHVDGDAVLGVHHDQAAVARRRLHGPQDLAVVAVEDARVGHEQLEAGDALADEHVHLLEGLLVDVAHDHVEPVVDGALALGLGEPAVEALAQRLADALHGEVDDGGGAAPRGRPGAGLERVGGGGAAEGQLHVGVDVDPAGDDVAPGGVDDPLGAVGPGVGQARARHAQGDDLFPVDQDVGLHLLGGGDDQAVADDGATHEAATSLPRPGLRPGWRSPPRLRTA
jgi:hypothetical protein